MTRFDDDPAGVNAAAAPDRRPYLLAVRCPRPGHLDVTGVPVNPTENPPPQTQRHRIECDRRVDGGYEGVLRLTAEQMATLTRVTLVGTEYDAALIDGRANPSGGHFSFVTTAGGTLPLRIECVPGVVLDLRIGGRPYGGTVRCTADQPSIVISEPTGAGPGAPVGVEVVRTGRDTGQWRIGVP
jgi:hypothetical protein